MEYGTLKVKSLGVSKDYAFRSVQSARLNAQDLKAELKSLDDFASVVPEGSLNLEKGDEISITFGK